MIHEQVENKNTVVKAPAKTLFVDEEPSTNHKTDVDCHAKHIFWVGENRSAILRANYDGGDVKVERESEV